MRTSQNGLHCCPACGSPRARVIDSRYEDDTGWKKRRRLCIACQYKWNTIEVPQHLMAEMRATLAHLQTIERLAAAARLGIMDSRLVAAILATDDQGGSCTG